MRVATSIGLVLFLCGCSTLPPKQEDWLASARIGTIYPSVDKLPIHIR